MRVTKFLWAVAAVAIAASAAFFGGSPAHADEGLASWYEGASAGEFAASHDTLPIGTPVTVSYGDRWVEVVITGRGPGVAGRELDLSRAPAEFLGLTEAGVDVVEYSYPGEADYSSQTYDTQAAPQTVSQTTTEVAPQTAPNVSSQGSSQVASDVAPPAGAVGSAGGIPVQPGDTLYSVAERNGVSVEDLAAANGLGVNDMLYIGDTLVAPAGGEAAVGSAGSSPGYPGAAWYPASDYGNYTGANRPVSNPVDKIVVHTTQGSYESAMNWFQDPASGVSAHYTVRGSDGLVGQSVSEANIAHHAGNWDYNQTSVGIEHEGYVEDPNSYTDAMYQSSAQLGAYLSNKYGIPINRQNIVGHNEVPGATHTDPGPYWDWNTYLGYMEQYANGAAPATTW